MAKIWGLEKRCQGVDFWWGRVGHFNVFKESDCDCVLNHARSACVPRNRTRSKCLGLATREGTHSNRGFGWFSRFQFPLSASCQTSQAEVVSEKHGGGAVDSGTCLIFPSLVLLDPDLHVCSSQCRARLRKQRVDRVQPASSTCLLQTAISMNTQCTTMIRYGSHSNVQACVCCSLEHTIQAYSQKDLSAGSKTLSKLLFTMRTPGRCLLLTCCCAAKRLQKLESQINSLSSDGAKGFRSVYEGIKDGNSESLLFFVQNTCTTQCVETYRLAVTRQFS